MKASVVVEGGADVGAVTGPKFPRLARVGLVMNEDFVSKGAKWCGIIDMWVIKVLLGGDEGIQCGLVE